MTAELPPLGPTYAGDRETTGVRPSEAGRYEGGFCHRPDAGGQRGARGVVPPEDNCITCGDIAVEVRVVRLLPDGLADVDTGEGTERVSVALVGATVGDTILVHAGEAIAVVGR
jgi:hydrogenase expression/formation protein HypC